MSGEALGGERRIVSWPVMLIAAIVVAALLVYAFLFGVRSRQNGSSVAYAPAGELTPGFPQDLILSAVAPAAPDTSYRIAYPPHAVQTTATFAAGRPILFVAITYDDWFTANGWSVTSRPAPSLTAQGMMATKGGATASVSMVAASPRTTTVTISEVSMQ